MRILILLFTIFTILSCEELVSINDFTPVTEEPISLEPKLNLLSSNSPFLVELSSATFHENIAYGQDSLNVFDFFKPNKGVPSSLCIIIHGGAFYGGDKTDSYSNTYFKELINNLLANNIAVASINYRLIETNETEGLIKSLNDSKRALQFMRYHANSLDFEKQKVIIIGTSAGASTALWIGFNDEMAEINNSDPILKESTRIEGIVGIQTQATYDVLEWHNTVFSEYQPTGFNLDTVKSLLTENRILSYFGVRDFSELISNEIIAYRNSVDMINLMSNDDPEFYITTAGVPYILPDNPNDLFHHPLHVKSLKEKSDQTSSFGIFYCPELEIDTRNGENIDDFIIRKIGK